MESDFLVLGNTTQNHDRTWQPVVGRDTSHEPSQRSRGVINVLNNVDRVPSFVQIAHQEALLYVFEDNEGVIKMIIKGRSPTRRHVSRSHRFALDWFIRSNQQGSQNPNQVHRHQKPTCRHADQGKFHT